MIGSGLLSPGHLALVLVVLVLVFGAKRLPELARSLGTGMRELRSSLASDAEGSDSAPRS